MMSSISFDKGNIPFDTDVGSGSNIAYQRKRAPGDQLPDPSNCDIPLYS